MKKACLILGVILYIFSAISFCEKTEKEVTIELPVVNTYEPVKIDSKDPLVIEQYVKETQPVEQLNLCYGFTDEDIYILAQLLCGASNISGDGEYDFVWNNCTDIKYNEMSKVLCVVMNRTRSDLFPDTVIDVVMQKNQFSVMPANAYKTPDNIAIEKISEWCIAYDQGDIGVQNIPENHLYFSAGPNLTNITRELY